MQTENIDTIDVISFLGAVAITASAPTLLAALPLFLGWYGLSQFRRSNVFTDWMSTISHKRSGRYIAPLLLPPRSNDITPTFTDRIDATAVPRSTWASRISGPIEEANESLPKLIAAKAPMQTLLDKAPKYISYEKVPEMPTPTSVLIGYDIENRKWLYADFGHNGDTLHALIAGQTGAGKDSELRLWYTQLTSNNSPKDVQFVILDGKGEWLTPALMQSPHMYIKPAGGTEVVRDEKGKWIDRANERIEESMSMIFELITERQKLFQKIGATNIVSYRQKTGVSLPLIFVVMTDVGTNIEQQLEMLVKMLTFKGRSFGIRLIISMQTVSGQDTGWRNQLALAMSGFQQLPSADAPNLGIPVRAMMYRPSELPSPDDPKARGLFVTRKGTLQSLIKAVHLPDAVFERYCELHAVAPMDDLLTTLLTQPPTPIITPEKTQTRLTKQQAQRIVALARAGKTKTEIMIELGWTNGQVYKEKGPAVDILIRAVKR